MKRMWLFYTVSYYPSPRDTWWEVRLSVHDSPILRELLLNPRGDSYSDEPSLEFNHFLNTSPPSSPSNFPSQKTIRYHLTAYCDWHPTGIYKSQTKLLFSQVLLEGVFLNPFFFFLHLCSLYLIWNFKAALCSGILNRKSLASCEFLINFPIYCIINMANLKGASVIQGSRNLQMTLTFHFS